MENEITPEQKAKDLVNYYYGIGAKNQLEAIEIVELIVLTTFCQQTDSLHGHVIVKDDYDMHLIKSAIIRLKWQQELAYELHRLKNALSVQQQ